MQIDSSAPLLAFDTSTDTLSVALRHAGRVQVHTGAGGARASATLVPVARALLEQAGIRFGDLGAIVFGRGPGSFTGLRTACAVAQGLAFGARPGGLPVLPVDTLLAVAEEARARHGTRQVVAAMDARMGEVYSCAYRYDAASGRWQTAGELSVAAPENVAVPSGWTLAGNARAAYGERLGPGATSVAVLPTAEALLRLAPVLVAAGGLVAAADALPLYIRDKVAKTTAERMAEKAAA